MSSENHNPIQCTECEASIMDALDGDLDTTAQAAFDRHIATCSQCSRTLADAQRGAAWLDMLKFPRPEPSADLMNRILAQTSGNQAAAAHVPLLVPSPHTPLAPASGNVIIFPRRAVSSTPFRSLIFQPRLAMTAAMAFFSIALTMNLIGFHPTQVKVSELRPSSLQRDLYQATARIAQYYDNLPVVSQLESRVRELGLTESNDGINGNTPTQSPAPTPGNTPRQQTQPASGSGTSYRSQPVGYFQVSRNTIRSTSQGVSA